MKDHPFDQNMNLNTIFYLLKCQVFKFVKISLLNFNVGHVFPCVFRWYHYMAFVFQLFHPFILQILYLQQTLRSKLACLPGLITRSELLLETKLVNHCHLVTAKLVWPLKMYHLRILITWRVGELGKTIWSFLGR